MALQGNAFRGLVSPKPAAVSAPVAQVPAPAAAAPVAPAGPWNPQEELRRLANTTVTTPGTGINPGNVTAPGNVNLSNMDPAFQQYQMQVAQQLQQQASGQGPSLAQMQLQQATDRTLNSTLGAIRSATGSNAALSGRTAALAASQQMANQGAQSGMLRLQEQQGAQSALANLAMQGRAGNQATQDAQLRADMANQNTQLQTLQGNQDAQLQAQIARQNGSLQAQQIQGNIRMGANDLLSGAYQGQQDRLQQGNIQAMKGDQARDEAKTADRRATQNSTVKGLTDMAASAFAAFSDKDLKKNVKSGDLSALIKSVSAKEFDYKDSKHGEGKHLGVMAQDLEKTPYGKSMVIDTPQGKMVDTRKVAMAALAGVAALSKKNAKE